MKDIFVAMAIVMTLAVPTVALAGGPAVATDDCAATPTADGCAPLVVHASGMNGVGLGAGLALLAGLAAIGGAASSGTN